MTTLFSAAEYSTVVEMKKIVPGGVMHNDIAEPRANLSGPSRRNRGWDGLGWDGMGLAGFVYYIPLKGVLHV